jgi:ADP-ribose pyrophosphatase YjhB (NUDIX family)
MKKLRIISRAIIYQRDKILLVKNVGGDFWYPPGGAWNFQKESIIDAAKREVKEETGLDIEIRKLLYVQEFHPLPNLIFFEVFWLAKPSFKQKLNKNHQDLDKRGQVEKARWFSKKELKKIKVFPEILKSTFWKKIKKIKSYENPFIGIT